MVFNQGILILIFSCFMNVCGFSQTMDYSSLIIPAELLKNANDVIRLNYRKFEIKNEKSATLEVKYAVTLLNEKSEENYQFINYDSFKNIKKLSAIIYDGNGKEIRKVKQKDFSDRSSISDFSIYEDDRLKFAELNHQSYPYTIEIEYTIEFTGLMYYPIFAMESICTSLEKGVFIVESPWNLPIRYKSFNCDVEPTLISHESIHQYTWTIDNKPAIKYESYGPYYENIIPIIKIAPTDFEFDGYKGNMKDWNSIGKFMYDLNKDRDILSPVMKSKVQELTKDAHSNQEKISILYNYLQVNMRYVSVQLGIGGWQTFDAEYVEKNKYGDCKALSNFMKAMLKEAGILSYQALIYSDRKNKIEIDPEFAVMGFANHVILNIPDENLWLECTSNDYPVNYLGYSNADRSVLLLTEAGGIISRTPKFDIEENKRISYSKIQIDGKANSLIESETILIGPKHDYFRYLVNNFSKIEIEKIFLENSTLSSANFQEISINNNTDLPNSTIIEKIQVNSFASSVGSRLFLPLNKLNPHTEIPIENINRKNKICVKNQYSEVDTISFYIPKGYKIESIPQELTEINSEFGKYKFEIKTTENSIICFRSLEVYSGEFPSETYQAFRDFYKEIVKGDSMQAVLVKI